MAPLSSAGALCAWRVSSLHSNWRFGRCKRLQGDEGQQSAICASAATSRSSPFLPLPRARLLPAAGPSIMARVTQLLVAVLAAAVLQTVGCTSVSLRAVHSLRGSLQSSSGQQVGVDRQDPMVEAGWASGAPAPVSGAADRLRRRSPLHAA